MKTEQQRIAIAEACGYKWFRWGKAPDESWRFLVLVRPDMGSFEPCNKPSHDTPMDLHDIPDYLNNLNAMHEAEEALTYNQYPIYTNRLLLILERQSRNGISAFDYCHASAAEKAEAFLRTIGKWETSNA